METTFRRKGNVSDKSSYRTYEEWKLGNITPFLLDFNSSYRTYEEWKRFSCSIACAVSLSSYRTYEEWKL